MMKHLSFASIVAVVASVTGACTQKTDTTSTTAQDGGAPAAQVDAAVPGAGPIAPECSESFCAQVDASASLDCYDPISDAKFTMSMAVRGRTTEVTCAIDAPPGGGQDLLLGARPENASDKDVSEIALRIRGYEGPGRYPLVNLPDDGANLGLAITANSSRTSPASYETVGTNACVPSPCEAIVAPETDPLPNDPMAAKEWRVRVTVECPAGGRVTTMACEANAQTACTFISAPTIRLDVACRR